MKYLTFWEFCPEELDKAAKKFVEYQKELEKNPEKYPTYVFPPHAFVGQTKGFSVVEATPEQINNYTIYWTPFLKLKYMPIVQSSEFVGQYMKSK